MRAHRHTYTRMCTDIQTYTHTHTHTNIDLRHQHIRTKLTYRRTRKIKHIYTHIRKPMQYAQYLHAVRTTAYLIRAPTHLTHLEIHVPSRALPHPLHPTQVSGPTYLTPSRGPGQISSRLGIRMRQYHGPRPEPKKPLRPSFGRAAILRIVGGHPRDLMLSTHNAKRLAIV